ncbi:unnamed protein product [Prunus armeniaca]
MGSNPTLGTFPLPNQSFDDLPQTYAVFGVMAVMLVVSAEFAGIPIILLIGLSVIRLRYDFLLVHQYGFVGGIQQSECSLNAVLIR